MQKAFSPLRRQREILETQWGQTAHSRDTGLVLKLYLIVQELIRLGSFYYHRIICSSLLLETNIKTDLQEQTEQTSAVAQKKKLITQFIFRSEGQTREA